MNIDPRRDRLLLGTMGTGWSASSSHHSQAGGRAAKQVGAQGLQRGVLEGGRVEDELSSKICRQENVPCDPSLSCITMAIEQLRTGRVAIHSGGIWRGEP